MNEGFWIAAFTVGLVQGLFLFGVLWVKEVRNRAAARWLAWLVAVFASMVAAGLLRLLAPAAAQPWIVHLAIHLELALGPLVWLFVAAVVRPDERPRQIVRIFLPLAVGSGVWLASRAARGVGWLGLDRVEQSDLVTVYVAFKALVLYSFLFAALRLLRGSPVEARMFTAGRRPVGLGWLRRWLYGLVVVAAGLHLAYFLTWGGLLRSVEIDHISSLVLSAMIYLVSWMVLVRPWVLSVRPRTEVDPDLATDAAALLARIEDEQLYTEPDLTLAVLATRLGTNEERLSSLLNSGLGTTFYGLLARLRLARFETLAADPDWRAASILDLAFEAGFASKASFYRTFGEGHDETPAAFRRRLLGASSSSDGRSASHPAP